MSSSRQMSLVVTILTNPWLPYVAEIDTITEKVRESIDCTKLFQTIDQCEEFVRSTRYEYIIIIVTPDKVKEILKHNIHQIRHVQSIFLFDPRAILNPDEILDLRKSSYKMRDVSFSTEDLYQNLWKWIEHFTTDSGVLLSVLADHSSESMTTNVVNNVADFAEFWYPLYLDFLLELPMHDPERERTYFIEQCRLHYSRNPGVMKFLDEFETNYSPSRALYYYSREEFLYRVLNRALRQQAIDKIIMLRFLLHDLRKCLCELYEQWFIAMETDDFSKDFYRGQLMCQAELNDLQRKHRLGTLITTNSFLSTTMTRALALTYSGQSKASLASVLFEVTVSVNKSNKPPRKPFAYIGSQSAFGPDETEVVFSPGSFFKINKIFFSKVEEVWIVHMIFINEDDVNQEIIKDFHTLRACPLELVLINIGNLLANHSKQGICRAKAFYQMIIDMNISKTLDIACHIGFGWLALKEKDARATIERQNQVLDRLEELSSSTDSFLIQLKVMCYNGIGNAFRLLKDYDQALNYFLKAQALNSKVSIDKYAMYDGYQNITTINVASIYKITNKIDEAWTMYKKLLAYEMNTSTLFHGHTYLTIAQAGLKEAQLSHDIDEYERCSKTWKSFLDTSLSQMSSNYRRNIISGVLILGFEYANNEQTYTMAIDYFKKVIVCSQRYVNINRDDRLIVLQCKNQVSRLLTKTRNYDLAIEYAFDALKMCGEYDLTDIIECYESLTQVFEERLANHGEHLTPDDINRYILFDESSLADYNIILDYCRPRFHFDPHEFTFGQFLTNYISPFVKQDTDYERQLAYCWLKMAALIQMQGCIDDEQAHSSDDDLLKKQAQISFCRAQELIHRVNTIMKNESTVQKICTNNLAYMERDFDSIIQFFMKELEKKQQRDHIKCIGENSLCYIAHLYKQKGYIDEEKRWYERAVKYFETHGHFCEHTVECFRRLANVYENSESFTSAFNVYESLVHHLIGWKQNSFFPKAIEPILQRLVKYLNEKSDVKRAMTILQRFVELVLLEENDDKCRIDQLFKEFVTTCRGELALVSQAYLECLEVIFKKVCSTNTLYIQALQFCFNEAVSTYTMHKNDHKMIETCQHFIELLLKTTIDRTTVIATLKSVALDFEALSSFAPALNIYTYLGQFIVQCQNKEDLILAGFVITRCKFIKQKNTIDDANNQIMLLELTLFYHSIVEPKFVLSEYLRETKENHRRHSASSIYMKLLEFCLQQRSSIYQQSIKQNIDALLDRPSEFISFVESNCVDYHELILHIVKQHIDNILKVSAFPKQSTFDIRTKIVEWLSKTEDSDDSYWIELLHYLLEWQSLKDECLASCYLKLNEITKAISVFDAEIYGEIASKFNKNACRRYLQYAYPQALPEQRIKLEEIYRDHFLIEFDSLLDTFSYRLLPIE